MGGRAGADPRERLGGPARGVPRAGGAPAGAGVAGAHRRQRARAARWRRGDDRGPLAHTGTRLVFHNRGRGCEADSRSPPPEAAIARFGMKVGEEWREARVVTRARGGARSTSGSCTAASIRRCSSGISVTSSARGYSRSRAGADKELVIAYDHQVSAERPYVLALEGLPAVPSLSIQIDRDSEASALDRSWRCPGGRDRADRRRLWGRWTATTPSLGGSIRPRRG